MNSTTHAPSPFLYLQAGLLLVAPVLVGLILLFAGTHGLDRLASTGLPWVFLTLSSLVLFGLMTLFYFLLNLLGRSY